MASRPAKPGKTGGEIAPNFEQEPYWNEDFKFEVTTKYGEVPNKLIPNFNGIIYYIQTNFARTKEEHESHVQPIVEQLLSENEDKYTSWVETKREMLVFSPVSQVTVVSFRVRDAY